MPVLVMRRLWHFKGQSDKRRKPRIWRPCPVNSSHTCPTSGTDGAFPRFPPAALKGERSVCPQGRTLFLAQPLGGSGNPQEAHAHLLEMGIGGQRVPQPQFAHNHKAREIGE